MTYTDPYKYPASHIMDDDFKQLRNAIKSDKQQLFASYCRKVIAAKGAGTMPLRDAAYSIAATMFIKELDEPLFEELVALAGELELPEKFVNGDPEKKWQKLVALIAEYEKTHKTQAWLEKMEQEQDEMERRTKKSFEKYGDE